MKHKLVHKQTGEEHICEKVVIDGWDYYVSGNEVQVGDIVIELYVDGTIGLEQIDTLNDIHLLLHKKVIATNNPSIDIPKLVDEVEMLAHKYFAEERFNWEQENPNGLKAPQSLIKHYNKTFTPLFRAGYNKSQETHPNSDDDMIEFNVWQKSLLGSKNDHWLIEKSDKELLQIWKEQRTKTLYYE